jgi:hypothetical protein
MASVSQVECSLKYIMEERANVLAREMGCIERQRKCSGADLLQTLVFFNDFSCKSLILHLGCKMSEAL